MRNETYSVYSPTVSKRVLNGMHTVGPDDGVHMTIARCIFSLLFNWQKLPRVSYAGSVAPDQPSHQRNQTRELQCPLIGQRYPILQISGECSSQFRLRGCTDWSETKLSTYGIFKNIRVNRFLLKAKGATNRVLLGCFDVADDGTRKYSYFEEVEVTLNWIHTY